MPHREQSRTLHIYQDPIEGFRGFLAYTGTQRPLAAGGLRVQRGLTGERIVALADAMGVKEDVLQLNVDGAKCGIDYDPHAPGTHDALRRFLSFLAPQLAGRLSLGPDMGTTFGELEQLAREVGIPSIKAAIAGAQGLPLEQVLKRLRTLDVQLGPLTLGERRAGHGLAHAALAAARHVAPTRRPLTCALQGFGTLGRGAAATLHESGVQIVAVADEHRCIHAPGGLPIARMLAAPLATPVHAHAGAGLATAARETALSIACDVLVLAACEDALDADDLADVHARIVVVGANNGLAPELHTALHARGVVVVPDCVAGAGGSAAMDALFAPALCPDPRTVLVQIGRIAQTLTQRVLDMADAEHVAPWVAAQAFAREQTLPLTARPYGLRTLGPDPQPASDRLPGCLAAGVGIW